MSDDRVPDGYSDMLVLDLQPSLHALTRLNLIMDRWEISELVSCSHACSARKEMSDFSCACNALLIESCYTNEHKVIHEESLLIVRGRRTNMKVPLLQKGNLLSPSFYLTTRNRTAGTWTEPFRLVHAREGTDHKIGEKQHEYCT